MYYAEFAEIFDIMNSGYGSLKMNNDVNFVNFVKFVLDTKTTP